MPSQLLKLSQVCEILNVKPLTVRKLVKAGKLKSVNIGAGDRQSIRFRQEDLQEFISRGAAQTEADNAAKTGLTWDELTHVDVKNTENDRDAQKLIDYLKDEKNE